MYTHTKDRKTKFIQVFDMTKLCIFGALLSAVVLVGCDRDVHVDNRSIVPDDNLQNNLPSPPGPNKVEPEKTTTNPSARNSNVIYGQLLDFETDDKDDKINAVLSSTDPSLAKEILNGTITWDGTKPNRPEISKNSYTIESSGNDETGRSVKIKTRGDTLTKAGEFVAIHELNTGGKIGLQSAGSPVPSMKPSDLPSGDQNYNGTAIIRKDSNVNLQGTDTNFNMTANFQTKTVTMIAITTKNGEDIPAMVFKTKPSVPMVINNVTGAFSTDDALIGLNGGDQISASISGYFAGTGAEGVHGLAYSNDTQNYTGAFYGKKSQ